MFTKKYLAIYLVKKTLRIIQIEINLYNANKKVNHAQK